jgi:NAD(P)-dependent dehydrogenase (short-subunit alcohol dehydrogenase family)
VAKTVLITGASKGIGRACALRLHRLGMRVLAGVRSERDGEALRAATSDLLVPLRLDVTSEDDIAAAASRVDALTGGEGLHGLVNNAGVAVAGPLEFLPPAELRRQLEINVVGQVAVTQALLPAIRRARGRIVLIGSVSGRSALPFTGAYAASKHALEAVADALRVELRPSGIDVVIVEPGVIATPIWATSIETGMRLRAAMPPELERLYGARLDGIRRRAERGMGGLPPDVVARAVEHALTSRRPRTRYLVGRDARLRVALRLLLPDRWRDALIERALARL